MVAGRTAILLVNALHGLLLFYQRDYKELNLDALFGLKIIEGLLLFLGVKKPRGTKCWNAGSSA